MKDRPDPKVGECLALVMSYYVEFPNLCEDIYFRKVLAYPAQLNGETHYIVDFTKKTPLGFRAYIIESQKSLEKLIKNGMWNPNKIIVV